MGPAGSPLCVQTILASTWRCRGRFARSGGVARWEHTHQARLVGPGHGVALRGGRRRACGRRCVPGRSSNQPPIAATVRTTTAPTARATRTGIRGAVRACASSRHNSPPGENAGAGDGASAGTYEESVSRSEGSPSAESPPRSATHASSNALLSSAASTRSTGRHWFRQPNDEERHDQDHQRLSGPR